MALASCLVDTNILLRATRRADPQHQVASTGLARLANQGTLLYYAPQNIAELWNTMTRPAARNGLGLSVVEADREVRAIENGMILLPDNEAVYREWRRIIVQHAVLGVQVHDARLAASMGEYSQDMIGQIIEIVNELNGFQYLGIGHKTQSQ